MNREMRRAMERNGGVPAGYSKDEYIHELQRQVNVYRNLAKEYYDKWKVQKGFDLQQAKDFLAITLHENFSFGPERNKKAVDEFYKLYLEFMDFAIEDSGLRKKELSEREKALGFKPDYTAGDETLSYTWTVINRKVKEAMGPYYEESSVRYSKERLYDSERDLPSLANRR